MNEYELNVKKIDEKIYQLQEAISTGRCESFEEYKRMCGEIKGLLTARSYVQETQEMVERSQNE
jgi:hypothetical protein